MDAEQQKKEISHRHVIAQAQPLLGALQSAAALLNDACELAFTMPLQADDAWPDIARAAQDVRRQLGRFELEIQGVIPHE